MELSADQSELIAKIADENGFGKYEIHIESGSKRGDNFLGIIKRVNIKNEEKSLSLILKIAQKSEGLRKTQPTRTFFLREMFLYEKVFKEFAAFEEEHNISNRFIAYPKFYGKCDEDINEYIVLEDMREKQFFMANKQNTMGSEQIKAVLKEYAKFHSISLAMKHKQPERFRKLTENLNHFSAFNKQEKEMTMFIDAVFKNAFRAIEGNLVATEALKKYQGYLVKDILMNDEYKDQMVVTHGDCWCNNLLFRYEGGSKTEPSQVCIIDWQISKLGSPGHDLSYFLFVNGSPQILDNYKSYLKYYHDVVCQNLKEFSCDPDEVYSFEIVESQFKKYTRYTLWICILLMRILLCDSEEAPDLQEVVETGKSVEDVVSFDIANVDEYNRRMAVLIEFMTKNNLI